MKFLKSKKIIIVLVLLVIIAAGVFYYWRVMAPRQQADTEAALVARMMQFEVKDSKLDQKTVDQYFKAFDENRQFFASHQNSLESFSALVRMALMKQLAGDYQGAEEIFLYTHRLSPKSYIINGNLGHLYLYYLKDYKKAEEYYQQAVANAQRGNLYTYYAEMYDLYNDGFKDEKKTKALLDQAIQVMPESTGMLLIAGEYYIELGDRTKALDYFQQVLKLEPTNQMALKRVADLSAAN